MDVALAIVIIYVYKGRGLGRGGDIIGVWSQGWRIFFSVFGLSFSCLFSCSVLEGSLVALFVHVAPFWLHFELILVHFGDFLRMGGICENYGFTIVKLGFLRVRGVPDRSFFLMFFRYCF